MHLMACNICVEHLQNDVVGKTHAHDLKGINGGNHTLLYGPVSCVSNIRYADSINLFSLINFRAALLISTPLPFLASTSGISSYNAHDCSTHTKQITH